MKMILHNVGEHYENACTIKKLWTETLSTNNIVSLGFKLSFLTTIVFNKTKTDELKSKGGTSWKNIDLNIRVSCFFVEATWKRRAWRLKWVHIVNRH